MSEKKTQTQSEKKTQNQKEINKTKNQQTQKTQNQEQKQKNNKNNIKKLELLVKQYRGRVKNSENKIKDLKIENKKALDSFLEKAQHFQKKAKDKIEQFKKNHKEKVQKEVEEIKKYAISKIITDLIEPLLNLEIAVKSGQKQNNQDIQNYVIGFQMLLKQIDQTLESYNIIKILPRINDLFDPETMEAISTIENKIKTDKVVEVKKYGYKLHDRVIKPATVIIGK